MAGIDVRLAIEKDYYAVESYKLNHPKTIMKNIDIKKIEKLDIEKETTTLLFGGYSMSRIFHIKPEDQE